jgi:hypothetical protein
MVRDEKDGRKKWKENGRVYKIKEVNRKGWGRGGLDKWEKEDDVSWGLWWKNGRCERFDEEEWWIWEGIRW